MGAEQTAAYQQRLAAAGTTLVDPQPQARPQDEAQVQIILRDSTPNPNITQAPKPGLQKDQGSRVKLKSAKEIACMVSSDVDEVYDITVDGSSKPVSRASEQRNENSQYHTLRNYQSSRLEAREKRVRVSKML